MITLKVRNGDMSLFQNKNTGKIEQIRLFEPNIITFKKINRNI